MVFQDAFQNWRKQANRAARSEAYFTPFLGGTDGGYPDLPVMSHNMGEKSHKTYAVQAAWAWSHGLMGRFWIKVSLVGREIPLQSHWLGSCTCESEM